MELVFSQTYTCINLTLRGRQISKLYITIIVKRSRAVIFIFFRSGSRNNSTREKLPKALFPRAFRSKIIHSDFGIFFFFLMKFAWIAVGRHSNSC